MRPYHFAKFRLLAVRATVPLVVGLLLSPSHAFAAPPSGPTAARAGHATTLVEAREARDLWAELWRAVVGLWATPRQGTRNVSSMANGPAPSPPPPTEEGASISPYGQPKAGSLISP